MKSKKERFSKLLKIFKPRFILAVILIPVLLLYDYTINIFINLDLEIIVPFILYPLYLSIIFFLLHTIIAFLVHSGEIILNKDINKKESDKPKNMYGNPVSYFGKSIIYVCILLVIIFIVMDFLSSILLFIANVF